MTAHLKKQSQIWAATWKAAGPELERVRRQEIRNADTRSAIESLDAAFKSALLHFPAAPYSGLVDQQQFFQRLKK